MRGWIWRCQAVLAVSNVQRSSIVRRNFVARASKSPEGARSPLSHRASVLASTPMRLAASFRVIPRALRH
jgi:hypothetical protein